MKKQSPELEAKEAPEAETPETVEDPLRVEVKTANGVKTVVGDTEQEVAEQVDAVKSEPKVIEPDINNPAHGNLTHEDLQSL